MVDVEYRFLEVLDDETREAVNALLREHNRVHNGEFFRKLEQPEHVPEPLTLIAYDENGAVVGGLFAETRLSWLKVSIMAVAEAERKRGMGRRLLERAEREAVVRGCRHAYLDTMDYQAPEFYQKCGYQVVGKLADWDSHGHAKYLFAKRLKA